MHSVQKEDVERIIVHTNDTDTVVISCVYYASTLLRDLSELSMWVRTARGSYLPIHGIAAAVGPSTSHALSFIHILSERDTTSYSYFTGKKTYIKISVPTDIMALEDFVDGDQGPARITAEVVKQAKELVVSVFANKGDMFEGYDLASTECTHFLTTSKLCWRSYRPRRTHLWTTSQTRGIGNCNRQEFSHLQAECRTMWGLYGWTDDHGYLMSMQSTRQAWPQHMMHTISCGCTKGCSSNTPVRRRTMPVT